MQGAPAAILNCWAIFGLGSDFNHWVCNYRRLYVFFYGLALYILLAGRRVGNNYWGKGQYAGMDCRLSPPFHTFDTLPEIKADLAIRAG